MTKTFIDQAGNVRPDRRQNPQFRELFDAAYVMVEPFFDPNAGWGGHSLEHLAFRVLRERCSCPGRITARSGGAHQRMGAEGPYQGKIPSR